MKKRVIHVGLLHPTQSSRILFKECISLLSLYDVSYIAIGKEKINFFQDGVKIYQRKKKSSPLLFLEYLFFLWNKPADVYHCHEPEGILLLLLLKIRRPKVTLIFDVHEYFGFDMYNPNKRWIVRLYYAFFVFFIRPCLLPLFDGVVTVTPHMKEQYTKYVKQPIVTVCNYPSHEAIANLPANDSLGIFSQEKDSIYLIHHGLNITKERGLHFYLELLNSLDDRYKFVFIGKIAERERIFFDNFVKKHHLEKKVIETGQLPYKDVMELLKTPAKKIGIFIPEDVGQMKLTVPIKVYEWIALGIPQIVGNHILDFTNRVAPSGAGIAVPQMDKSAHIDAVHKVVKNYDSMVLSAKKVAKQFSWEHEKESLLSLYQKIVP